MFLNEAVSQIFVNIFRRVVDLSILFFFFDTDGKIRICSQYHHFLSINNNSEITFNTLI